MTVTNERPHADFSLLYSVQPGTHTTVVRGICKVWKLMVSLVLIWITVMIWLAWWSLLL